MFCLRPEEKASTVRESPSPVCAFRRRVLTRGGGPYPAIPVPPRGPVRLCQSLLLLRQRPALSIYRNFFRTRNFWRHAGLHSPKISWGLLVFAHKLEILNLDLLMVSKKFHLSDNNNIIASEVSRISDCGTVGDLFGGNKSSPCLRQHWERLIDSVVMAGAFHYPHPLQTDAAFSIFPCLPARVATSIPLSPFLATCLNLVMNSEVGDGIFEFRAKCLAEWGGGFRALKAAIWVFEVVVGVIFGISFLDELSRVG